MIISYHYVKIPKNRRQPMDMRKDADRIIEAALQSVMPDQAVIQALSGKCFGEGRVYLVAAGKAAWQMAKTAAAMLGERLQAGVCVTKYGHVKGEIPKITCHEAGHPVPDENSFRGTQAALDLVSGLKEKDTVVFLLSGGGSALFEKPLLPRQELADITAQLLACGAAVRGKGRAVCKVLRPCQGVRHCAQRYSGGSSGHDCLGPRLSGQQYLRTGPGGGGEIQAPAKPWGHGAAKGGDAKGTGQCGNHCDREREKSVPGGGKGLPGAGV